MQKLLILLVASSAFAAVFAGKMKHISWGEYQEEMEQSKGALHCENGDLSGMEILVQNFLPLVMDCQAEIDLSDIARMSLCFMEKLGLVDSDGAPNVPKMDAFIVNIISKDLLRDLPTLPLEVHVCAEEFAMNYNGIFQESQEESTGNFLQCVKGLALKYHDLVGEVCKLEAKRAEMSQ